MNKQFISTISGEVVTITNNDPLYVTLSNFITLPYLQFIKEFKELTT